MEQAGGGPPTPGSRARARLKKTRKKKEQREKVAAEKPRGIACIIAHCTAGILMVFSEQIVLPTYTCNRSPYTHACPDANNERYFCFVRLLPAGGLQVSRQARDFHGTATIARERESYHLLEGCQGSTFDANIIFYCRCPSLPCCMLTRVCVQCKAAAKAAASVNISLSIMSKKTNIPGSSLLDPLASIETNKTKVFPISGCTNNIMFVSITHDCMVWI
jgi:hypothetical protein